MPPKRAGRTAKADARCRALKLVGDQTTKKLKKNLKKINDLGVLDAGMTAEQLDSRKEIKKELANLGDGFSVPELRRMAIIQNSSFAPPGMSKKRVRESFNLRGQPAPEIGRLFTAVADAKVATKAGVGRKAFGQPLGAMEDRDGIEAARLLLKRDQLLAEKRKLTCVVLGAPK